MSDGIEQVKLAFTDLLKNISKPRRRLLYQQIGRELARNQRRRIKAQQNPDGSPFEPRKKRKQFSKKKGRIKNQLMFKKIVSPSHLKIRYEQEGISLGFYGGDAAIANVHQYGLYSSPSKYKDFKVKYAQRELLGFSEEDIEMIERFVIKAIAEGSL
ncbi:MAG: phage virion morphogenesis protein [Haemophilus parainfluenzae]|jgi:phage virion morphogenesis protein|uniref:phage virion morphogenesis protein n=1 Tax=uncultured Haemophilus sp. TaxID=237779 RepID=UPI001CAE3FFE|nr:phage virion morphogenesis protein [uncultured Haemophilus sp.]MBF1227261.1 phage virion morphogenesis protein [Haemophilus parainfluenzae]DAK33715.1 MAG TPA: virion morphogenesis protein [Caudoviricetes sp.]MBS5162618.1 phage virion morphogenesis protein [Haemophilus parainfluenzae]DAN98876.1 MAG TPA: virion morphogenesis protein [Caudoviricetes sp.]DAP81155.1 MAG TPA: virion morphogenesis protein [Caudoviricetes sp.]